MMNPSLARLEKSSSFCFCSFLFLKRIRKESKDMTEVNKATMAARVIGEPKEVA